VVPALRDWNHLRRALFDLCDEDGAPCDARALWGRFHAQAPPTVDRHQLAQVEAAIERAQSLAFPLTPTSPNAPAELLSALSELGAVFAELLAQHQSSQTP
jgi:hypothetical protein